MSREEFDATCGGMRKLNIMAIFRDPRAQKWSRQITQTVGPRVKTQVLRELTGGLNKPYNARRAMRDLA